MGFAEGPIPFIPVAIAISVALGYNTATGVGVSLIGAMAPTDGVRIIIEGKGGHGGAPHMAAGLLGRERVDANPSPGAGGEGRCHLI